MIGIEQANSVGQRPRARFALRAIAAFIAAVFAGTAAAAGTYKWTDDGCPSPCGDLGTGLNLVLTFVDVGTKYVRLTVTDALGRSATVEHNVVVR